MTRPDLRGEYGLDGNMIGFLGMSAVTASLLVATVMLGFAGFGGTSAITALAAAVLLATLGIYLHTTRRGK